MVDIKRITSEAREEFKNRILASGFHDNESGYLFVDAMAQCFGDVLKEAIQKALDEKGDQGRKVKTEAYSGDRGADWYYPDDPFPFGKYGPDKGDARAFGQIPTAYFEWLGKQEWIGEWPGVLRFINGEAPPAKKETDESEIPF